MKPWRYRLGGSWPFWCAAVLASCVAAWQFIERPASLTQNLLLYADRGEMLFHAVRAGAVSYSMPFLSLLAAAQLHLGFDPALPGRLAGLLICLAAYGMGVHGGGPARGAVYALAATLANLRYATQDFEQALFSLSLMIFLNLEFLRQAGAGPAGCAASGLAAGITMLIRSPLFAFPPLAVLFQYPSLRRRRSRWLACSAVFLILAYLPLAPWARLNHSLFGRAILFEKDRSVCNIITGAKGMVNTIRGDAKAFAGLSPTESVYRWAAREVLEHPGIYAASVVKRLWSVFRMFPFLFLLAGVGILLNRSAEMRFLVLFCAYFLLVHCLLSIEGRYFYPLRYILALMIAGGSWELLKRFGLASDQKGRDYFTIPIFVAAAALSAAVLLAILRYPGAARVPLAAVDSGLKEFPADAWLWRNKAEILFSFDLTAKGMESLEKICRTGAAPDLCYIMETLRSITPAPVPRLPNNYDLRLVKLLRELQLGRTAAARETFAGVKEYWLEKRNGINGKGSDIAYLDAIVASNKTLWDMDIPAALVYWPVSERASLIRRLAALTSLTPKLRSIELRHKPLPSPAEKEELSRIGGEFGESLLEKFDWKGNLEGLTLELLARVSTAPAAGGDIGLLLGLRMGAVETMSVFAPHNGSSAGPALKAVATLYLDPGAADAARALKDADPSNFAYTRIFLDAAGFSPAAIKEAEADMRSSPYPLTAASRAYAKRGEMEKAARLARSAAKAGWNSTRLAIQQAGDYRARITAASKVLREHPGSADLLNTRGALRLLAGDPHGAEEDFEKALKAAPRDFSALMNYAWLLEIGGEKENAAGIYDRALETAVAPEILPAERSLRGGGLSKKISDEAVELITKKSLEQARTLLIEAVAKDRDNFEARMNLCFLAAKANDIPLGEEHCNQAVFLAVAPPKHFIALKDQMPTAFYARGLFYVRVENKKKACNDLRKAVAKASADWPPASEARKQVEKACATENSNSTRKF